MAEQISKNEKIFATLSYCWVLCLIPVFFGKTSSFVKFHAKQGLVLLICWFVASLLSWIPVIGQLAVLILAIAAIFGIKKVLQGEEWEMPVLGKYAKQIKL